MNKSVPAGVKPGPYLSERNIPLFTQEVDAFKRPIVTMENYCKWYGVYILHPDGSVEGVDPGLMADIQSQDNGCLFGDHNYHPRLLNKLAKRINGAVDSIALEVVTGRWVAEIMDGDLGLHGNID